MAMPRRPPRHHNLNSSAGLSTAASALILSADRPFAGGRPNWPPLEARSFAPHLPRTAAGRTQQAAPYEGAVYLSRAIHNHAAYFVLGHDPSLRTFAFVSTDLSALFLNASPQLRLGVNLN